MTDTKQMNKEYAKELRERFAEFGDADMTDAELLALILSYTNVQSRLCETVEALEAHFGAVRHAYHSKYSELMRIYGMSHHAAILILMIGKLVAMKEKPSPVGKRVPEYETMFSAMMCYSLVEELWAAAIDDKGVVTALERVATGDDTQVTVTLGRIVKFATHYEAKRVIIAHSHPNAIEVEYSSADEYAMAYIGAMLDEIGVELIGQVLVAGKKAKLMPYVPQNFK